VKQPKILIVDNEPNVRFVLEHTLRREEYSIDMAANGQEAIDLISANVYDLLLLDLHMEPVNGIEVLNALRKINHETVVIILTAHGSMETAVEALRLETFDYLIKPATPDIIRKRVREGLERRQRLARRQQLMSQIDTLKQALNDLEAEDQPVPIAGEDRFVCRGNISIDRHHREVTVDDNLLNLTTVEYNILVGLVEAAPAVVPALQLVKLALGYETEESEAREMIKVYIHHLRQKVEVNPAEPVYIKTVRHQGYLWCG
jgi:DNA-binding response OmpR family regulator